MMNAAFILLRCMAFAAVLLSSGCSPSPPAADPAVESPTVESPLNEASPNPQTAATAQTVIRSLEDESARAHLPSRDDWDTEVQSELALAQLNKIAAWIEQGRETNKDSFDEIFEFESPRFEFSHPEKDQQTELTVADNLTVLRADRGVKAQSGLRQFLISAGLYEVPPGVTQRVKFKLYRIDHGSGLPRPDGETRMTQVRFELSETSGAADGRSLVSQVTSTWNCEWLFARADPSAPQLVRIDVSDWEQVRLNAGPLFDDVTESVLKEHESYAGQMLPGIPFWLGRIPKEFLGQFGHHGMAVGDVNGDGLDDIYVCDAGGLPNRLYVQQSDGTARDVSAASGVDFLDDSTGALLVDLDNDGDQDLVVAMDPAVHICENDGAGNFSRREPIPVDNDSFSLIAADYDVDGDLDVYVCGYEVRKRDQSDRGLPFPIPYHDASNGGRNVLLRNEGGLRFVDVTDDVGLDQNNSRFSMAASWEDFDNDGDQDLYVANDFGRNCLYRNDNGRFTDIAAEAGVQDHASGMSVSCGDFDRNGQVDIYVGNMFSAAGNRVMYQRRFLDNVDGQETTSNLLRMARGNSLFSNEGDMRFTDAASSGAPSPTMGRWAWASPFVDMTNNGWPDLVVANGYVTNEDSSDL